MCNHWRNQKSINQLLEKDKLNTIKVVISQSFIDSYISHDESISVNNVLREYNGMKPEIKNRETSLEYNIEKTMKRYCIRCKKYTGNENSTVRKTKQNMLMLWSNYND